MRTTTRRRTVDRHRNVAVTDTFEPGSTFKLVTVAAALSEGLVNESSPFTLPYEIEVADRVVHDAEPRGTETMTVGQILARSSNVGAITLAQLLGPQRLGRWIERFGFGKPTGIDFPGETPGIVLPVERWSGSTIGNVPIGQGIGVTAVQMAAAYAAVANGGMWIAPHLVDHVSGGGRARPERRRVLSAPIADQVLRMLENVVLEGTGTLAAVPGLHDRRQDRDRGQAGSRERRLLGDELRRLVHRHRPCEQAALRDPRLGGRAARSHLGRHRRSAGVQAHRGLRRSSTSKFRPTTRPH